MLKEDWIKAQKAYENIVKQATYDLDYGNWVLDLINKELAKYDTNA